MDTTANVDTVLDPSPDPAPLVRTAGRAAARGLVAAGLGLLLAHPLAPLLLGLAAAATALVDRALLLAVLQERTTPLRGALAAAASAGLLLAAAILHGALGLSPGDPRLHATALAAALDRLAGDELQVQALAWCTAAFLLGAPFGLRVLTDETSLRGATPERMRRNGRWLEVACGAGVLLTLVLVGLETLVRGLPADDEGQATALLNAVLVPGGAFFALVGAAVTLHLVDGLSDLALRRASPRPSRA